MLTGVAAAFLFFWRSLTIRAPRRRPDSSGRRPWAWRLKASAQRPPAGHKALCARLTRSSYAPADTPSRPSPSHNPSTGAAEGVRAANRELLYDASKAIEAAVAERAAAAAEAGGKSKQRPAAAAPAPAPAPTAAAKPAAAVKPAAAAAAAAAEPPAAKPKKRKASDAAAAKGNGHAPSPAPPAAAAAEPDQPSSKKKQKKARKAAAVAALAAAAAAAPDERTPEPEAAAAAGRPKSVRFSLRRNIVNTIGNAPVPADVRTPPSSRPKGSALKKAAPGDAGPTATRLARRLAAAAGAGPSKLGGRGVPSPYSVPRPRAAEFF